MRSSSRPKIAPIAYRFSIATLCSLNPTTLGGEDGGGPGGGRGGGKVGTRKADSCRLEPVKRMLSLHGL